MQLMFPFSPSKVLKAKISSSYILKVLKAEYVILWISPNICIIILSLSDALSPHYFRCLVDACLSVAILDYSKLFT